jgi:predicted aldo/keto reductase-like oxidoreductase
MTPVSRRSFLRHSALTTGALATFPVLKKLPMLKDDPSAPILKRTLGRTGLKVSVVSMGVMRADNPALVKEALKSGVVHLDTAHGYQKGKNEEMLGALLKEYPRESFVIATKVPRAATKEAFLADLDISLQRLQMKYVDILYLHGQDSRDQVLNKEMLDALTEAQKSGRTRFLGVSTHKNEPEVIRAAIEAKIYDVVLTSFNYKQDHASEVLKAIDEAAKAGVGIVAMKTMVGGFLDKERTKPVNCKAALKWVLQHENVATCIPGVTTFDQLSENLSVNTNITLTEQEKKDLAYLGREEGLYCDGCGACEQACPQSMPIHDFMRAYMYTYGYGSPRMGRDVVHALNRTHHACTDCTACSGTCEKGFDVKGRIADVSRLREVPEEFLA